MVIQFGIKQLKDYIAHEENSCLQLEKILEQNANEKSIYRYTDQVSIVFHYPAFVLIILGIYFLRKKSEVQ